MPEAERVKPRTLFIEEAIQYALESRWHEALASNDALLEKHGADEDAYNRRGKALTELGRHQDALDSYQTALQINPLNLIAQKNSRKLLAMLEAPQRLSAAGVIQVDLFAEEPGKSGLTVLTGPAAGSVTSVAPGDTVELVSEDGTLQARTVRGVVLGDVDAKLARRLIPLVATGNRYSGAVARVEHGRIEVIIREVHQAPENTRKSSFPIARSAKTDFRPYAKGSLLARDDTDPMGVADDFEDPTIVAAEPEDDLPGMRATESDADLETAVGVDDEEEDDDGDDDDEPDVDVRPEDEY